MSFFNKKKEQKKHKSQHLSKAAISSVISPEMHINGEIRFKGKVRIDGIVEGNIQGEYLIISETGRVKGDMKLDSLICHGTVEGDIEARQVTVHTTASIRGILKAEDLTVEPGAAIEGEIQAFSKKENKPLKNEITTEKESGNKNIAAKTK